MKVEQIRGGKHIRALACGKIYDLTTPTFALHRLDKLHPLDDINNDLCVINGHYLHIITYQYVCRGRYISFRAGKYSRKFFDLFFVMALSLGGLSLASHQALRKGEGEGKESLVATVCACADFLSRESPRACYVSHKTSFKHGFDHEGLSFVVNSNRSVLILGNTTTMKKQWVTILVSRAKRTTEQNTSSSRQYTLTYDV